AAQETHLQDGADSSSFRAHGMVGIENHRALLDRFAGVRPIRPDYIEAAIIFSQSYFPHRDTETQGNLELFFSLSRCLSGELLFMDLNNKRVLVVGLGRSGVASALFLKSQGAQVTVSDTKSEDQLREEIPRLLDQGIAVETGGHGERTFRDQDLIVVSPGVPSDAEAITQARALGQPVIGEIELAFAFLRGSLVAITGSNGKTTTTTLVGEILQAGGFATRVGGNIGTPAISLVSESSPETVTVLEVSSFQLETIVSFRPKIAVVLNVTPDHLDRHRTFRAYVDAKARIFENQQGDDFAVLNYDDPTCRELARRAQAKVFWFSRQTEVPEGAFLRGERIRFRRQ